jgi:hypothetical protein
MQKSLKLINSYEYLLELELKDSLYLNEFFKESDFISKEKVSDKTDDIACIDDDDEIDKGWSLVESSEKSELSENSESLDFEKMNDEELIAYYNSMQPVEKIELGVRAEYRLNNYIFDYYVRDSLLVVYGKLFYQLSSWTANNINTNMRDLIIDFELRIDTTNARLGQIDILNSIIKANVNNNISYNKPLSSIANEVVFIPFRFEKTLPKNVKLISSTKKEAFNFNDLQYLDYEWKPKFGGFVGQSSNFSW